MKLKFKSQKQLQKLLKMNPNVVAIDEDGDSYFYDETTGEYFFNSRQDESPQSLVTAVQHMIDKGRNTFNILSNQHG
jgi:hypothetical protein